MIECSDCGKKFNSGNFCPKCGHAVNHGSAVNAEYEKHRKAAMADYEAAHTSQARCWLLDKGIYSPGMSLEDRRICRKEYVQSLGYNFLKAMP